MNTRRHFLSATLAALSTTLLAAEKPPILNACQQAVKKWEAASGLQFNIPFPVEKYDPDYWIKQPIAAIAVGDGKVFCTRPTPQGDDKYCFVHFMIFPSDLEKILADNLECELTFDPKDGLLSVNVRPAPVLWTKKGHFTQLNREDDEALAPYIERVMKTYRERAKNPDAPKETPKFLDAFERILRGISGAFVLPNGK